MSSQTAQLMSSPHYCYETLTPETNSIRLLRLLPGRFDDAIRITIWYTALDVDDPLQYEALSYVWGDPVKQHHVFIESAFLSDIDGQTEAAHPRTRIGVTRNLDEALRYLRYVDRERTLWIDAICIDQSNLAERGNQVQKMADIFKSAYRVVMWLGPAADDSAVAIQTLCDVGSQIWIDYELQEIHTTNKQDSDEPSRARLKNLFMRPNVAISLRHLFYRPYFERLWIRQEIHAGRAGGIALCGHDSRQWALFEKGAYCWSRIGENHDRSHTVYQVCSDVDMTLAVLLQRARTVHCLDPRDKVYAVLGMMASEVGPVAETIVPDYSKSIAEVYGETFRALRNDHQPLALLQQAGISRDDDFRPTWSPDWSRQSPTSSMRDQYASVNCATYVEYPDDLSLQVNGCAADTVSTVFQTGVYSSTTFENLFERLRTVLEHANQVMPSMTEDGILDRCSHVCTIGEFAESCDPPISWMPPFEGVKSTLRLLRRSPSTSVAEVASGSNEVFKALRLPVWRALSNRSFITTDKGLIGLAPIWVQPGDTIAVLIGSRNPMALTPPAAGRRRVLGECFIDGLNWGEALVGPVPTGLRSMMQRTDTGSKTRFQDIETGEVHKFDPRIDWNELEIAEDDDRFFYLGNDANGQNKYYRRPDAEYFRAHGVPLEMFTLI